MSAVEVISGKCKGNSRQGAKNAKLSLSVVKHIISSSVCSAPLRESMFFLGRKALDCHTIIALRVAAPTSETKTFRGRKLLPVPPVNAGLGENWEIDKHKDGKSEDPRDLGQCNPP